MPPDEQSTKSAPSLSDFSSKPRPSDMAAPKPFHLYELRTFARTRGLSFPDDFIELRNPTAIELSAILFLGPAPGAQPFRSRSADPDDDDDEASAKVTKAAWAYQCTLFCKFVFPAGATLPVPRSLVSAFVQCRDGFVVSGMIPQLELPGDPHPPLLHPALAPESEAAPFAVPKAKSKRGVTLLDEVRPEPRIYADGGVGDDADEQERKQRAEQ